VSKIVELKESQVEGGGVWRELLGNITIFTEQMGGII